MRERKGRCRIALREREGTRDTVIMYNRLHTVGQLVIHIIILMVDEREGEWFIVDMLFYSA